MSERHELRRRQATSLGRSGPRSKTGCRTCKLRRVRCNEKRPICGDCERLQLDCVYLPPQKRRSRRTQPAGSETEHDNAAVAESISVQDPVHMPQSNVKPSQLDEAHDLGRSNSTGRSEDLFQAIDATIESSAMGTSDIYGAQRNNAQPSETGFLMDSSVGASSVLDAFGQGDRGGTEWQTGILNDYLALPDPTFPFTSMAFIGSLDVPSSNGGMAGCVDFNAASTNALEGSAAVDFSNEQQDVHSQIGTTPDGRYSFTVSPPILSPNQEESLLVYFERQVRPPASLVGVDPVGWTKIWRCAVKMARARREPVLHAVFAVTTLLTATSSSIRLGMNRDDHVSFASRLQEAACAAMQVGISHPEWVKRSSQALLLSVFLLAWFETAYDEGSQIRPTFPSELAEKIIVHGKEWDNTMSHVLQWLNMLDAKASHLGGSHLLSEPALRVARSSHPSRAVTGTADGSGFETPMTSPLGTEQSTETSCLPGNADSTPKKPAGDRMAYLLSSSTQQTLPIRIIRMDVFNILLQPAFEFHMTSQAYFRRIGCHDRHHRKRGTPEDEFEIMKACMTFEEELQDLWKRRPGILNLNAEQLKQFVSEDLAQRLEQLFSVYIATFWGHFIYIHRVAFWNLDHTPIVKKALQETGNMMRRSVCQPMDRHEFDITLERTSSNSIHPGLMWTCFMFGCEVREPVQERWAVAQLRALGKLKRSDAANGDEEAELLAFSLDEKGAQNALKASRLLELLIDRQTRAGDRVDGKYLCQELFGCHFYII